MSMTNEELTEHLALEMGLDLRNRLPAAKEVFKYMDIELLPHSSADTTLCEIYDWSSRAWRTTNDTFIPWIYADLEEAKEIMEKLRKVERVIANVADFEFDKESLIEIGAKLPKLFGINVTGEVERAKKFSLKVSNVTKARLSNSVSPGMEIARKLSKFKLENAKEYRKKIKFEHISEALFYAENVEIELEKESDVELELGFSMDGIDVAAEVDTATKKKIKLTYSNKMAPFGASMVKGKDLF